MPTTKTILNYIGQIRLYSLADLILLLIVIGSSTNQLVGAVLLHVAFLAYLESKHDHVYRTRVPVWIAYVLGLGGIILYGKVEGILYIICSYLYTKKTKKTGVFGPLLRALQYFFIVGGILGYESVITYLVAGVFLIRNLLGDFRDTEKDRKENVKTIPVVMGVKRSVKYIHLAGMILSSTIWWSFSSISTVWLALVIIIQVGTYNLTPR